MPDPLTLEQIAEQAEPETRSLLCLYLDPMTPDEHRRRRVAAGYSQFRLAIELNTQQSAIAAREAGTRPIPRAAALFVRQLTPVDVERSSSGCLQGEERT